MRSARQTGQVPGRMHANETLVDMALATRLLRSQFPRLSQLPLRPVVSSGTENAMFRLGDELALRLPRLPGAAEGLMKESAWLAQLAPQLPVEVPVPVELGQPAEGYPFPWAIVRWVSGEPARPELLTDPVQLGRDLAGFLESLQSVAAWADSPHHARDRHPRLQDEHVRLGLEGLRGEVDAAKAEAVWSRVLSAPDYAGSPVWCHADLMCSNLLLTDGRLTGVIDSETCGIGDPAVESHPAWALLPKAARQAFRKEVGMDEGTWLRGVGWILPGVFGIVYYRETNPVLVAELVRAINEVLADF